MRKFIFLLLFMIHSINAESQVLTNDTVVCIIDTTKSYVEFIENPIQRDNYQIPAHWQIGIDGHYYDHVSYDKDIAYIGFMAGLWRGNLRDISGFPKKKKVLKKGLTERFIVVDDEWINQQTSLRHLKNKLGIAPFDKYNYIIFSQDYDCADSDSVTMHRVEIGYSEVQY
jgi:hypothetical protein